MSKLSDEWRVTVRSDYLFTMMVPSDVRQLIGEIDKAEARIEELKAALDAAAKSLETIGELAGEMAPTDLLRHPDDIRAYAKNRALPARAALNPEEST
jgi:hypothetical protein